MRAGQMKPIEPQTHYESSHVNEMSLGHVNCTIQLFEGQIEVSYRNDEGPWFKAEASISMRLLPTPRVLIKVVNAPATLSTLYTLSGLSTIRLQGGPGIKVQTLEIQFGENGTCLLKPDLQPVTSTRTGAGLQSVRFNVLNFPSISKHDHPAMLQSEPWLIELRPHRNCSAVKDTLKVEGGYGLTHEGLLKRCDNQPFKAEDAEKVLRVLYFFLSFARGGNCGITRVVGTDNSGSKAWEQWGAYAAYPWFAVSSWLDHRHNNHEELALAFPGFMRKISLGSYDIQDRVHTALYWYLRSNESNSPYSAIILTQAALERLARDALSEKEWEEIAGSERDRKRKALNKAIEQVYIDRKIPVCCKNLRAANYRDGPEALVKVRNNLVHARADENLSLDALLEALNLGQWYTELLLLKKFGYQGNYANRMTYTYEGKWRPEVVPWAR